MLSMNQDELKQSVARAALEYILPRIEKNAVIGIGTGSTANHFIDLLAAHRDQFQGTVASSASSTDRLQHHGIPAYDLNTVSQLRFYVDGTDESNSDLQLIKGGGAALTREKIVAACANEFICIADESKWVDVLGAFPLPVEVIPMARAYVMRAIVQLGGEPQLRKNVVTDNGNEILDVHGLHIDDPLNLENNLNQITGLVCNGLFAARPADILLLGTQSGIKTYDRSKLPI